MLFIFKLDSRKLQICLNIFLTPCDPASRASGVFAFEILFVSGHIANMSC